MVTCHGEARAVMRRSTLFVALACWATLGMAWAGASDVVVRTNYGPVRGSVNQAGDLATFLGIPFAAPPTGSRRFAAPQPPFAWAPSIVNATSWGPSCMQPSSHHMDMSEDCLYMNVWAPYPLPKDKPLPVMLWIYGGCFGFGTTTGAFTDGTNDILASNASVIIVSANYRVNVFGFAGSHQLRKVSGDNTTGNLGLLDQRAAMQFVKANIRQFGGDPDHVTIWGESAGGVSVSNHMVARRSWPLFHGAISESGPFGQVKSLAYAQAMYDATAALAGCDPNDVDCLREVPATKLLEAGARAPQPATAFCKWGPVIDGVEFDANPLVMAQRGQFNGFKHGTVTESDWDDWLHVHYGNLSGTVNSMYNVSRDYGGSYWDAMSEAIGEENFNCLVRDSALAISKASGRQVFLYYFVHEYDAAFQKEPWMGTFHSSDLHFVFDDPLGVLEPGELPLAHTMVAYWQNFAVTGDPNRGPSSAVHGRSLFNWPAYNDGTLENVQLNLTVGATCNLKGEICAAWQPLYPRLFPGYE